MPTRKFACREVVTPINDLNDRFDSLEINDSDSPIKTVYRLALERNRKWPGNGVHLRVAFIDRKVPLVLQNHVLVHMNAWSQFCNVSFALVNDPLFAEVRVSFTGVVSYREKGKILSRKEPGYWSAVGTGVLNIDTIEPTMMLDGFDIETSEKEFIRTVRHETGHTLGFQHEHLRPELVERIDRKKAIALYTLPRSQGGQGWTKDEVLSNLLTPLWKKGDPKAKSESDFFVTKKTDVHSIMCYDVEEEIMITGMEEPPITGGDDFSEYDKKHAALVYPFPEYQNWTMARNKDIVDIAASGKALYLCLKSGEIRALFEVADNDDGEDLKEYTIGKTSDPHNIELMASGSRLWMVEEGGVIWQWNGSFGSNTKKWTQINKTPNVQVTTCGNDIYYRTESGSIAMYLNSSWKVLYKGTDTDWISATRTHLYRKTKECEIYELPVPRRQDAQAKWKRIDKLANGIIIATNWRHIYQHTTDQKIWIYSGVDDKWMSIYQAIGPFDLEASEDRVFQTDDYIRYNAHNTKEGWKSLEHAFDNSASWLYTGGYVYEWVEKKGEVTRYAAIC